MTDSLACCNYWSKMWCVVSSSAEMRRRIAARAKEYADLSPQLADLSLLYLADQQGTRSILTLDRRDFVVYRDLRGEPFNLLPG